ncbi:DUF3987 domain-containing protein, partial [bacterium]|nr:DUF3987 domain-containing protein [bacterium]
MTAVTEAVGRYRAAGWKTVPVHRPGAGPGTCTCGRPDCDKPGKHPDPRHWPGGSADAAAFEGRNVGVLLGPDSAGLADVDLDCAEARLAAPHLLPPTPAAFGRGTAVTHHLYTVADGAAAFAKLTDPVRPGAEATVVELRWPNAGDDGRPKAVQTVFPPSLHYQGKELAWVRDGAPAAVPGAGLVAAVRRVAAAVLVARYAKPKARHDLVLLLANLGVRAGWTDDDTVVKFIAAVFAAVKDADKLEKVLRGEGANAVADARKRLKAGTPMTGLPALHKMLDPALSAADADAVVARIRDWLGLPDRDPPKSAAAPAGPKTGGARPAAPLPPYAPFPTHLLPPAVRDYVAATAAAMNCDPAYSALPVLAALGAAIGASHAASPKKRWKEPPYIWAVAIGRSGATKSPPYRDVEDLAEDVNDRLDREYRLAAAAYDADLEAWQAAKREARDGGPAPGPRPEPPVRRAFLKGDVTIEALVGALRDNPRGLLIGQDELAAWIGSFVKYAGKAGATDLPRWLQLHHAGTVNYTRKTGDPDTRVVRVRGVGLSVTGTIQPGILARVLTDEFRASGFLARLLVAMPAWRKRMWTEAEVDEPTRAAFAGLLEALYALPGGAWPDGKPCPHLVRLSAGAKAAFVAFYDANGAALETADDEMSAVMSKLEGYALRFALIFHCCRLRESAKDAPVTADDMAAAIELTAWFRAEAERVYQALAEPAELRAAREVARAVGRVAERHGGRVTARQLQRSNQRKYPTAADAETTLDGLVAAGLGRWEEAPTGGHPSRAFVPAAACDTSDTSPEEGRGGDHAGDPPDEPVCDRSPPGPERDPGGGAAGARSTPAPDTTSADSTGGAAGDVSHCHTVTPTGEEPDGGAEAGPGAGAGMCHTRGLLSHMGYELVAVEDGVGAVAAAVAGAGGPVGLDTETTGLDHNRDRVRLLQLATPRGTFLVDVFAFADPAAALAPVFEALAGVAVVGHNLGFDLPFLMRLGFTPGRVIDTMLASQVLHAGDMATRHGLRDVAARHLGLTLDKELQQADWAGDLTPDRLRYAALDAEVPLRAWPELATELEAARL